MTALNLFCQGDCAYLAADTAVTDQDGILLSRRPKVLELPRARIAVAWTGRAPMPAGGARACQSDAGRRLRSALLANGVDALAAPQNEIMAALPAALRAMHLQNLEACPAGSEELLSIALMVALWREGDGPAVYFGMTEPFAGLPAYTIARAEYYVTAPRADTDGGDAFLRQTFGRRVDLADPASFDPSTGSLKLLEAQRLIREAPCGGSYYSIGGRAILTEVSRRGVSSKVLHRWPDREGEPIRPNRVAVEAEPRNRTPAKGWRERMFGAGAPTPERIPA